jgi:DNA-binding transcriptional regulator LsrR (DeoR family)
VGQQREGDEDLLLAEVADLYYAQDLTQEQIARRFAVSRSNVSRMLKEARARGLVEIRIHHPLPTRPDLQAALATRFGLRDCLVLADGDAPESGAPDETARKVGALAARYLQANVPEHSIVGVGWGSTVYQVVTSGYLGRKPGMSVVQLMGSVGGATPDIDGAQVAARLGRALGARVYYLHAPMVVTDAAVRHGLLRDPHIRKTLEMARQAGTFVASVGAVSEQSGIYRAGYLHDADLEYIRGQGAVGDLCGAYYALDGSLCPVEITERTMAVGATVLRGVPLRVGVSWGPRKALANLGAVRSGLLNVLITDEAAARAMLALVEREAA